MEILERLIVDVARLDREGEQYRGALLPETLDLEPGAYMEPAGELFYDLFIQDFGHELLVQGKVWQRIRALCSRCGRSFEYETREDEFTRSYEINDRTEFIDLTDDVREGIILTLSDYPICQENCKGVCQKCGKNLNEGPCNCPKEPESDTWAALDNLK